MAKSAQSELLTQDLLQLVLQRPPGEPVGKLPQWSVSPQLLQQHEGTAGGLGAGGVGLGVGAGFGCGVGEGDGAGSGHQVPPQL